MWACNLGETVYTESQCVQLRKALEKGGVGFLFVDAVHVGDVEVRQPKDVVMANRKRRLRDQTEPWLLSSDRGAHAQNAVIKSLPCRKMWFGPMDLGRNKEFEKALKQGAVAAALTPQTPKHAQGAPSLSWAQEALPRRHAGGHAPLIADVSRNRTHVA